MAAEAKVRNGQDGSEELNQLPREANGYTTVFPIPSRAISLNGKLKQNPGY